MDLHHLGEALTAIRYLPDKISYLVSGFSQGFHLGVPENALFKICNNHPTAYLNYSVLIAKINRELDAGHWAGPFAVCPFKDITINPLGLVPKTILDPKNPDSYRMITDLCCSGINAQIDQDLSWVQYTKFDAIIQTCLKKQAGCYLAKTDIKSAFRIVPVHPDDWVHLGARCRSFYFMDKCLPFGFATSCAIFEEIARALEALVKERLTSQSVNHYLDDYIGCDQTIPLTNQVVHTLVDVAMHLGIPIAWETMVWATTCLQFLGLDVDTIE